MKLNGTKVPPNPVVSVSKHLKADVVANLTKQLMKLPTVFSPEDMGTLKRQHRRNSMLATSKMSLKNSTDSTQMTNWTTKLNSKIRVCFKFLKVLNSSTSIKLLTD